MTSILEEKAEMVPARLTKKKADRIADLIQNDARLREISTDFRVSVSRAVGAGELTVTVADLYGNCFVYKPRKKP
jgi:hypothetical protein